MIAVSICGNTITGAQIGIDVDSCAIAVRDNTIEDYSAYGIRITDDIGSVIRANRILAPGSGAFSGIRAYGTQGDLVIAQNTIGDSTGGIHNMGIDYEFSASSDTAMIKDNTIIPRDDWNSTGMYFIEAKPRVRANVIEGDRYFAAFQVAGSNMSPRMGAAEDSSCSGCSDTTRPGENWVVTDDPPGWYVNVALGLLHPVMAQCNHWCPLLPEKFYHPDLVVWSPALACSGRGRGGPRPEDGSEDVPRVLTMLPNAPNPFNPETVFTVGMPRDGRARLVVYDIAGRRVRTLVDGTVRAGWKAVTWDGRNEHGGRVASGVYFCRLSTDGSSVRRKVVLLK
jgi:hypothetical protein